MSRDEIIINEVITKLKQIKEKMRKDESFYIVGLCRQMENFLEALEEEDI